MFSYFLKYFGIFFLIVFLVLCGFGVFESTHHLKNYESFIGKSTESPRTEYIVTDRASHLAYLDTFVLGDKKIRYIDRGPKKGKVIVLLHGTPTNSWLWRKIIPGLIKKGYRVIAPDMLGFGASSMANNNDELSIESQSENLITLLKHLNIKKFSIAGHDQGSLRVWETVTSYPEKIESLIVFNSIGDREGFHPPAGFGESNMSTKFIARAMGSKSLGRIFAYGAMFGGVKKKGVTTPTMINGYLFPLFYGMNETYYHFITNFSDIEKHLSIYHEKFTKLNISTLVLWGKYDKILVGEEQIPVLKKLLKIENKNIHMLEAAHFVQEEVPGEIVRKIDDFIRTNDL